MLERDWTDAGQAWQGKETSLRLMGWSCQRRVILLRRKLDRPLAVIDLGTHPGAAAAELRRGCWQAGGLGICRAKSDLAAQRNSDPGSAVSRSGGLRERVRRVEEPVGLGGFTTQDLKRCRLLARSVALIYNWWELVRAPG